MKGFTLVELLVTLAVVAIVLTMGVPSLSNFVADNRLITRTNEFVADIGLARSAAIKFQRNASICVSTSYAAATPACTGGTNWGAGWIVWVDKDRDGNVDTDEVLRTSEPVPASNTFASTARSVFTFNSRGFINAGDTLTLCDNRTAETGRSVTVNAAGHTTVNTPACP